MKIYQNLLVGFVGLSLIVGGNTFLVWHNSHNTKIRATKIVEDTSQEIDLAIDISRAVEQINQSTEKIINLDVTKEEDKKKIAGFQEKIKEQVVKINSYVERGKNLTNKETQLSYALDGNDRVEIERAEQDRARDLESLEELKFQLAEFQKDVEKILELSSDKNLEAVRVFFRKDLQEKRARVKELLGQYQERSLEEIREVQGEIKAAQEFQGTANNYLAGINLALLGLFVGFMYRSTYGPIKQIKETAHNKKIKLNLEPKNIKENELTVLSQGFNWLINNANTKERIINTIAESTIVIGPEKTIHKANKATLKMLGYSHEELIGKKINAILGEGGIINLDKIVQTDYSSVGQEITYITKKGEKIPVAFSSRLMRDPEGNVEAIVCSARDISKQYQTERELKANIERSTLAVSAASSGMWDWDISSDRLHYSTLWKSMLGYGEKEIEDSIEAWLKMLQPEDAKAIERQINSFITGKDNHFEATYQIRHKSGVYLSMLCRAIALRNNKGRINRIIGAQIDITKLKLAQEKVLKEALYDEITGLPNRAALIQQLDWLYKNSLILARQRSNHNFALMCLELNRFGTIDESLGHKIGDLLLVSIIARLKANLPNESIISRLGEDKLAIVVKNIGDVREARAIASEIQTQLEKPFDLETRQVYVTGNIGIAMSSSDYERSEYMLRDAETALHRAKKSEPRCGYEVFEVSESMKVLANLELESDLRRAIDKSEFKVFYQPIVQLSNNKIIGFETSIYWQHPQKGLIYPDKFLAAATQTRSIVPITWSIIALVCKQMRQWQQQYRDDFSIFACIDLSECLLDVPDLVERLSGILYDTNLEPHNLKLKISESSIKNKSDRALAAMQRLQSLGIKISLDDFGKGYLSWHSLSKWPIDSLKINSSVIDPLHSNPSQLQVIQAMVNLASSLGINVIASDLETNKQSNRLRELGCQYGQGSLFSSLLTSEVAEALIANQYSSSVKGKA